MKLVYGGIGRKSTNKVLYLTEHDIQFSSEAEATNKTTPVLNEIEKKTVSGKNFLELFKYDDISLWWHIHPSIFPFVKNAVNFLERFIEILDKKNVTSIEIEGDFDKLSLIEQICDQKRISFNYSKFRYSKFLSTKKMKKVISSRRFRKVTERKNRNRIQLFKSSGKETPSLKDKIIFAVPTVYRRQIYDPEKKETVGREFIQGAIIDILKKMNLDIVGIDLDYTFRGDKEPLSQRLSDVIPWIPIELLFDSGVKTKSERFLNEYLKIIKNEEFKSIFSHKGINFWDYIEHDFQKMSYFPHLPTYIRLIESLKHHFSKNQPRAIFLPYEVGPLALSIIVAAEKNCIRTIGLQHGIIFGSNPDYSHQNFRSETNPLGMITPDLFLLYGNFARKILVKNNTYPQEKLIVFGHAMYFNLEKIKKNLQPEAIKQKYKIPKDRKIILFASGLYQTYYKHFAKQNYDEQILRKLIKTLKNNDDFFVILKPHPNREFLGFYKEQIAKNKCDNFAIIQGELFELLSISDILISVFSTIHIDAVAFGTKAILVTFGTPSTIEKYDVVLVSDLDHLFENIRKLLSDSNLPSKLEQNRNKFLLDQFNIPATDPFNQLRSILGI